MMNIYNKNCYTIGSYCRMTILKRNNEIIFFTRTFCMVYFLFYILKRKFLALSLSFRKNFKIMVGTYLVFILPIKKLILWFYCLKLSYLVL